jgi:tetratricopeptide (TPR) repeat protein
VELWQFIEKGLNKKVKNTYKLFFIFQILISIWFFTEIIRFDSNISKFLIQNDRNPELANKIFTGMPQYTPISRAVIKAYNENLFQRNCQNYKYFADLLLETNSRNPQTYYFRAACKEISGDLNGAIIEMKKTITFEKYNSEYLFALAVLYYNSGDIQSSRIYFNKAKNVNPGIPQLKTLEDLLKNKTK